MSVAFLIAHDLSTLPFLHKVNRKESCAEL